MSVQRFLITVLLLIALVLPAGAPTALAQQPGPSTVGGGDWLPPRSSAASTFSPADLPPSQAKDDPANGAIQTLDGLWMMPAGAVERMRSSAQPITSPQPNGGPDDFGYTFTTVPLNWIDASGGTNTGISSSVGGVGPIAIGFPFKYYENTYGELWVSRFGFLAFNSNNLYRSQSRIPEPSLPNDVIAPHWIPSYDSPNYVRYLRGGAAPNRWFVMEWDRQRSECCSGDPADDEFTFQAVLYESGDILLQYRSMNTVGSYSCQASGIEDSTGMDGLSITPFCQQVASNQAIRITRPAPAARVRISPQHYGAFIYPGEESLTEIAIRNTGELGADTYDLTLNSAWATGLYHADGVTPLTDTNGNGRLDTGPVPQGQTRMVVIKVWSSSSSPVGNHNTAVLTARSSLDGNKQKTAMARIAVPASFAQVYRDDVDGSMNMMLIKPNAQAVRKATDAWHWGSDVAVTELPNHNLIYVWNRSRCLDNNCMRYISEIEYTIQNPYGETVRPVAKLIDHSAATLSTYDYSAAVAVAPDGRVGLLWVRELYNAASQLYNFNLYWAGLDANGILASDPRNVTNSTVWGAWSDLNLPRFYNPQIAATGDYRFVLAWQREHQESAGWVGDIWYSVLNHTGGAIRNATKLTNGSPGSLAHYTPALASLASNRTFISWITRRNGDDDIFYTILDSEGGMVKAATNLSVDETVTDWNNSDAVQLSDGKIIAVWEAWGCFPGEWVSRIRYVLLDSAYNRIGAPSCLGRAETAITGDTAVSVTRGGDHLAVLTWMDRDYSSRRNLYYALVDANSVVVTPPTIYQTSKATSPYIFSSFTGYGNTTYSWTPPAGVDSVLSVGQSMAFGQPGSSVAPIAYKLAGRGGVAATSVRLIATLDTRLRYVSDTSGVTPTISGQTVTWNLPNLRLFDIREFQLNLEVAGGALGDLLPVQMQLTSAEPDLTPANNQVSVQVWVTKPVYLPLLMR